MRTTINVRDDLLACAREAAAREGTSLGDIVDHALILAFARRRDKPCRGVDLPSFRGDPPGLIPGVDIDRSAELWDLLDQEAIGSLRATR